MNCLCKKKNYENEMHGDLCVYFGGYDREFYVVSMLLTYKTNACMQGMDWMEFREWLNNKDFESRRLNYMKRHHGTFFRKILNF